MAATPVMIATPPLVQMADTVPLLRLAARFALRLAITAKLVTNVTTTPVMA